MVTAEARSGCGRRWVLREEWVLCPRVGTSSQDGCCIPGWELRPGDGCCVRSRNGRFVPQTSPGSQNGECLLRWVMTDVTRSEDTEAPGLGSAQWVRHAQCQSNGVLTGDQALRTGRLGRRTH